MFRHILFSTAALLALAGPGRAQTFNPADVCAIEPAEFKSWFAGGKVIDGAPATFADSLNFPTDNTKCDFYKWGHHMFLWLTSKQGGGIVLTSPTFYNVTFDSNGGTYNQGDASGQLRGKGDGKGDGKGAGKTLGLTTGVNRFALHGERPLPAPAKAAAAAGPEADGLPPSVQLLAPETIQPGGQAGGSDGLMSLNGSIIYYAVHANDVFAWFNTAVTNGVLPKDAPFPSTKAEVQAVLDYADKYGATLKDGNALAMEIKSAWIDADKVNGNIADYVTITADVPNYVANNAQRWTIGSPATVSKTIALVGMHVVGTVQNHPEMVWATFEHRANAPNNDYYISTVSNQQKDPVTRTVPYDSKGNWNFMQTGGARDGALVAQFTVDSSGALSATPGNSIQPNNTFRLNPWGSLAIPESAPNNTQLVTLNTAIDQMLASAGAGKDVRSNYIQIGSVWTRDGSIPYSPIDKGEQVGSLFLANTTMETYHQDIGYGIKPAHQNGCFGCHNTDKAHNANPYPTAVSHLFSSGNTPLVPKN